MLTDDDIREQLSIAYLHAVSAHAGFAWEPRRIDKDGVDGCICARGIVISGATRKSPEVGFQLKATTQIQNDADPIAFKLKQKNYEDLRGRFAHPRYLALLILPPSQKEWLELSPEALVLRRCMFWLSLRHAEANENTVSTTVSVPRANLLDVAAIRRLLEAAAKEEEL